jgi:hypothetical protein
VLFSIDPTGAVGCISARIEADERGVDRIFIICFFNIAEATLIQHYFKIKFHIKSTVRNAIGNQAINRMGQSN